jgi:PAS domain-containing protein
MLKNIKHQRNARSDGTAPAPTDSILESISDGVFTVDPGWRITSFNRSAEAAGECAEQTRRNTR